MSDQKPPLLQVRDLRTYFRSEDGEARAVDGISFDLNEGEVLGLVGESGSGKSVTALSIMRLISATAGRIETGQVLLDGRDLREISDSDMCAVRGNDIAMVFQEPMTSLNPVMSCGRQIVEALVMHQPEERVRSRERALEMLRLVGLPAPERRLDEYPHQLSGGMRQRVMIAMALACHPRVLIADEPTTALDVTVQAQILELLRGLQQQFGMGILLITHDLGIIAEMADRVCVMYAGKLVEEAPVGEIFANPQHPYTRGLLRSIPPIDRRLDRLEVIPGSVPDARDFPDGCRFRPRCQAAVTACFQTPEPAAISSDHWASCWRAGDPMSVREVESDG